MDDWISPNRIWKIHRPDGWKIENLKSGFGDSPIVYDSGKVAFDHPELVPEYVKDRFRSMAGAFRQRVALVNARRHIALAADGFRDALLIGKLERENAEAGL